MFQSNKVYLKEMDWNYLNKSISSILSALENPIISRSEIERFPFSNLEISVRDNLNPIICILAHKASCVIFFSFLILLIFFPAILREGIFFCFFSFLNLQKNLKEMFWFWTIFIDFTLLLCYYCYIIEQ